MMTFIVVFSVFALVMLGMAVGVMMGRPPIKGSCGGLGAVGVERACACTDVCKNEEQEKAGQSSSKSQVRPTVYKP